ncbi:MAG: hypothetical protein JXB47_13815 [Anaerolineae bacterium]|nr:hypothetical protein [Anaerolineae bacterium]
MFVQLLPLATNLPDIWGEGAIFAFSGMDGDTDTASGFVATHAAEPYGLLFHTPRRRCLDITLSEPGTPRIATGDVLAVDTAQGPLIVTFSAWHTLVGIRPAGVGVRLRFEPGEDARWVDPIWLSEDSETPDAFALAEGNGRFALAYGRSAAEAGERAQEGLKLDPAREVSKRLSLYQTLPRLNDPSNDRLLKKCFSVMKVNTLAPEGAMPDHWSTPDRVPHRDMWLWDSVFHTFGMNHIKPRLAWKFIKSVLDTQRADGMIPHQSSVAGRRSGITQPPVLAWGSWENYRAGRDLEALEYALPRLVRYLEWNCANRDSNGNGLLEWCVEADERCRSGESGMDNSPRFDAAPALDAVDFSVFMANDMQCLARIAAELGDDAAATRWAQRAADLSATIHHKLWDAEAGFYFDRQVDGPFSPVRAATGFLPLLLDDTPAGRVEALVEMLEDPAHFDTAFPVPSVSVSDPAFSTDMWRGPTWVNLNYLIVLGLAKHGRRKEARRLAAKTIAFVKKYYEAYGVIFEFFDAKDETPPVACDRKGPRIAPYDTRVKMDSIRDYHWSAALTACLLLDYR